ncbi:MAG TPA: PQQ-binding-like beta-propeller repeat protein [Pseudonocardiaceae bacterium]|jgi:hypothetical protein|nr:PQQ-binding-like beta-propeller repeat protein [Pseudonocardiaceae bacterium]
MGGGQPGPGGWQQQPGPYGGQQPYPGTGPTQQPYPGTSPTQQPYPGTGQTPQPYPQGPYPQPGYPQPGYPQGPYPQQPGYPPQFGAPGPKRRKPWPWLIPLVVVVIAAAIVVPILLTRGGGSSGTSSANGPSAPALKQWIVTAGQTGQFINGFGAWANGDDLITVTGPAVTAYNRADGSKRWSLTPPTPDALYCGVSRNISGDRLAVAYGVTDQSNPSNQQCVGLGLVNLKTGKFVWSEQLLQPNANPPAGAAMVIAGNSVFAGFNLSNFVVQVDLATGKATSNHDMSDGKGSDCSINDATATASTVYFLADCQPGLPTDPNVMNSAQFDAILAEDVNTGQQTGFGEITAQAAKLPQDADVPLGVDPGEFVSASPMVVVLSASGTTIKDTGSFVGVDSSLNVSWASAGPVGDPNSLDILAAGDASAGWTGFGRAFVANGALFAETTFENSSGTQSNKIVAVDATTGRQKWATGLPGVALACPVGVQGSSVVAVGQTQGTQGDADVVLANFDVNSGKLTSSRKLSIPVQGTNTTLPNEVDMRGTWYVAADNRVYAANLQNGKNTPANEPQVYALG